jgi:16S rRNA (cytidine1402-2'-O)-methyltransferase
MARVYHSGFSVAKSGVHKVFSCEMKQEGTLYIVATPIGNLEDVSLRALRILREAPLVACEDTRVARKLLSHYDIRARTLSYNEHSPPSRLQQLIAALDEGDVAYISDAGTPVLSDPGLELVQAAVAAGHRVEGIPGASAVTLAVAVSGLPARSFTFLGFLPRKGSARRAALEGLTAEAAVIFEAPSRLRATLADLLAALGDTHVAVCRELTKLHEEVFRGSLSEALAHFDSPRGEVTLVVQVPLRDARPEGADLVRDLKDAGLSADTSSTIAARHSKLSKREAYRLWHHDAR